MNAIILEFVQVLLLVGADALRLLSTGAPVDRMSFAPAEKKRLPTTSREFNPVFLVGGRSGPWLIEKPIR